MPADSMPPLRITSIDQAISIAPHLLGYEPREDLVVLVIGPRLQVTVRVSLDHVRTRRGVAAHLGPVIRRYPEAQLLMMAFSREPERARKVLAVAQDVLGADTIRDAIATDGRRWWSLSCTDSDECRAGHPVEPDDAVRAEAVVRGLGVLADRQALAAGVAGPTAETLGAEAVMRLRTRAWADATDHDAALEYLTEAVMGVMGTGEPPDPEAALRIAHLIDDDSLATTMWVSTCSSVARPLVQLWTAVLAHAPDELATRPLMLCGLAAWLTGDGALESCCLERASALDPDATLFRALDVLQRNVLHPEEWLDLNPDPELLAAGVLVPLRDPDTPPQEAIEQAPEERMPAGRVRRRGGPSRSTQRIGGRRRRR